MVVLISIVIIIVILLSVSLFAPSQSEFSQTINYADFNVDKTVVLSENERIETYSVQLKNPVIGFLIIPKTIASDISQIKVSGDFETEVIQSDPIIRIEPKDLGPGNKKIAITTQIGDNVQTSILLLIPYIEYTEFSETEKQQLDELIKGFSDLDANYFTIEESKKIMEEFSQNSAELKKKLTRVN